MKIQYMSDLHLEFASMPVPDVLGDVLVLAGDIHLGTHAIPWIEQCAQKFEHVIYILGNHEYYGNKTWKLPGQIRSSLAGYSMDDPTWSDAETAPKLTKLFDPIKNAYFLDNETVKIEDVYFHGSTLWSNAHPQLQHRMNDFYKIKHKFVNGGYGKFSPGAAADKWVNAKEFLHSSIIPGQKNVVITHHAPTFEMIDTVRYGRDDVMESGYASNIIGEFSPSDVKLWISGHTHAAFDKVVADIHTVSNCRGYYPDQLTENFNPSAIVEV